MDYQVGFDALHVCVHPALGFEVRSKIRAREMIRKARSDTAPDEDAAPCTECQGNVARECAQELAKRVDRRSTSGRRTVESTCRYLSRRQAQRGFVLERGKGLVKV